MTMRKLLDEAAFKLDEIFTDLAMADEKTYLEFGKHVGKEK